MALTVSELVTTWGFKIDKKPLKELDENMRKLKEGWASFYEGAKHLSELFFGEGASVFGLAEKTARAGVEFERTAEEVGTTTQKLQELNYAAKQWDIDPTAIETSLRHLSSEAVMAANGEQESMRIMAESGITHFRNAKGQMLDTTALLDQMAAKFQTMPDGIMKSGLAMQVLSRGGAEIIPILNRIGTVEFKEMIKGGVELGYIMGPAAIAASEKFTAAVNRAEAVLLGLRNTIGVALMPGIEALIDKFIKWYNANRQLIQQQVTKFMEQVGHAASSLAKIFISIFNWTVDLSSVFGGLGNVLEIVTVAMLAWTAGSMLTNLVVMVKTIRELYGWMDKLQKAEKLAFIWETLLAGGTNLVVLAGVGAVGLAAYQAHKYGLFEAAGDALGINGPQGPQAHGYGAGAQHEAYQAYLRSFRSRSNAGSSTVDMRGATFAITNPPGTSHEQAQHTLKIVHKEMQKANRLAMASTAGGINH